MAATLVATPDGQVDTKPAGTVADEAVKPPVATVVEPTTPVVEPKASETKPGDDSAAAAAPKPPVTYALTLPVGGTVGEADRAAVIALATEHGLSNADAQATLDSMAGMFARQEQAWKAETEADKTYGGDKLVETQKLARAVINAIRPEGHPRREAFLSFLNRAGAGNQLEVVAFFADLGKRMAEDSPAVSGGATTGDQDAASKLYGSTS